MLINILCLTLGANKDGGSVWGIGSIFSCSKGLRDCLVLKPITTKQQSVLWLVSQSRRMPALFAGTCWWISLAAASGPGSCLHLIWSFYGSLISCKLKAPDGQMDRVKCLMQPPRDGRITKVDRTVNVRTVMHMKAIIASVDFVNCS